MRKKHSQKKRSITIIWKHKEKLDEKNNILQMKKKEKRQNLEMEISYT